MLSKNDSKRTVTFTECYFSFPYMQDFSLDSVDKRFFLIIQKSKNFKLYIMLKKRERLTLIYFLWVIIVFLQKTNQIPSNTLSPSY